MIELSRLESHLWEAANILRGPVDAADFKTYIFPLLFFNGTPINKRDRNTFWAFGAEEDEGGYMSRYS